MTQQLDATTLQAWLRDGKQVTVLDVRPQEQRDDWYIPGSVHIDAYARLKTNDPHALDALDIPKDQPVVAVCAAGQTSMIAAERLTQQGYDAASLTGGMKAWSLAWNTAEVDLPDGVRVVQVRRTGKGCLSYLIVSDGEALVIDAAVEPHVYSQLALEQNARITGAVDTHIHADHLSRSRLLADTLQVPLFLPEQERVSYPFTPLRHGDMLKVGRTALEVIHTPGHTWESSSYYLPEEVVFTGDTLFANSVGRPDLEAKAGEARERARSLHRSLRRLTSLPGDTLVLPGHASVPLGFDHELWGKTLQEIKGEVDLLRLDEEAFVQRVTSRIPPTPENHQRIVQLNEAGELPEETTALEVGANRCAVR